MVEEGQAHRQHWHQALPARQNLGVLTQFGQEVHGFLGCIGAVIVERRRLHRDAPASSEATDAGLAGNRVTVTPNGARASLMALMTAGAEPIAPPSPAPL